MLARLHCTEEFSPEGRRFTRRQREERAFWDILDQLGPNETLIMFSEEQESSSPTIAEYLSQMTDQGRAEMQERFPLTKDPRWINAWGSRTPAEYKSYKKMLREMRRVKMEEMIMQKPKRRSRRTGKQI